MKKLVMLAALAAGLLGVNAAAGRALADAGGQGTGTIEPARAQRCAVPMATQRPVHGWRRERSPQSRRTRSCTRPSLPHPGRTSSGPTENDEGTATFVADDPTGVSASGRFQAWFGVSGNNRNAVQHDTNNFNLAGSDGSHVVVHAADQTTMNANGVITVNFSNFDTHCGP